MRFERSFAHSPLKIWPALTEADHLRYWFPALVNFTLTPGATLRFDFTPEDMQRYDIPEDQATSYDEITRVEAPNLLEYSWYREILRYASQ